MKCLELFDYREIKTKNISGETIHACPTCKDDYFKERTFISKMFNRMFGPFPEDE